MSDDLDRLVDRVRQLDGENGQRLHRAVERYRRAPAVQVTGRAGVGKTTLARALARPDIVETAPLDTPGVPDPVLDGDVVVYVVAESLQPPDVAALQALRGTALVALNKADVLAVGGGGWGAVLARADEYAKDLAVQVVPVVAAIAATAARATMTPAETRSLRTLGDLNDPTLLLGADLFLGADVIIDARARRTMLDRWELYGLDCAMTALRHEPDLSPESVTGLLHAVSGIDGFRAALDRTLSQALAGRGAALLDELDRLAARSAAARNDIEAYLRSDEALFMGLTSGLAAPELAGIADRRSVLRPASAEQARDLADWWREVAQGPAAGPGARRAALRVQHAYTRAWARLARGRSRDLGLAPGPGHRG